MRIDISEKGTVVTTKDNTVKLLKVATLWERLTDSKLYKEKDIVWMFTKILDANSELSCIIDKQDVVIEDYTRKLEISDNKLASSEERNRDFISMHEDYVKESDAKLAKLQEEIKELRIEKDSIEIQNNNTINKLKDDLKISDYDLKLCKEAKDKFVTGNGMAKLTCKTVKAIRKAVNEGVARAELATKYKLSVSGINRIVTKVTYKKCK